MQLFQVNFKAMGSPCELTLFCASQSEFDRVSSTCIEEMERLEAKYSRYRADSLLSHINDAAGTGRTFQLDNETWLLLRYATIAYKESGGLFDVTSGVLRQAWDFKQAKVPSQSEIDAAKTKIGFDKIQLQQEAFLLPEVGMELDFGGLVKEYAADVLSNFLRQVGINHGLVDLAGDIAAVGPQPDGEPWDIGIKHPAHPGQAVAYIPLHSGGLASSGDYARCFELDGTKYSHLLNPITGWPVQGLAGVSVWAEQCIVAGTLATITMLKGEQEGKAWIKEVGAPCVTVDQSFKVENLLEDPALC